MEKIKYEKVTRAVLVALALTAGVAGQAQATLVTHAQVNGLNTFQDTSTGLVWLKLSELFNVDYLTQVSTATTAGFTVADFATVSALGGGSADLGNGSTNWDTVATIIGSSNSRDLMWGNYADTGASNPNGWYYAYRGDTTWSNYNPGSTGAYTDLGLFAYQTSTVPEPATIGLLGLGLLGLGYTRRSKNTKV